MGVVAKSYIRKGFLIYEKSMNLQALRYMTTFLEELKSHCSAPTSHFLDSIDELF
jgi:hypothetical protein